MDAVHTQTAAKDIILDSGWWDNFIRETKNLTETKTFDNCLSKDDTAMMRGYFMEILADLATRRTNRYGYRVYIDGRVQTEAEMAKIYDSPPLQDESLEDWVKRTFEDKKFGMIINEGERFNRKLSRLMALKAAPLLQKIGYPQEGINFSLFIGNYGWTPLGIHQDSAGESVIHFHLGPGPKTMYTWGHKAFRELVDIATFNNRDVEPLLPNATKFEFGEGDLYFMPNGEYHIGYSDELSLSLTFWTYNHTKFRFSRRLHAMITDQFLKENTELVTPDRNHIDDTTGIAESFSCFEFTDGLEGRSYKELIEEMYKDLRYSISSNCGYRTSPFPFREEASVVGADWSVINETPYVIKYRQSADKEKLYVYVRGHKFSLNNLPCIYTMLNRINEGGEMSVKELLVLLDKDWPEDVGLHILGLLFQHHGIIKIDNTLQ
jgi:hypothetical protein